MIEFLNYVPVEGSFGAMLLDIIHQTISGLTFTFACWVIFWGIRKIIHEYKDM